MSWLFLSHVFLKELNDLRRKGALIVGCLACADIYFRKSEYVSKGTLKDTVTAIDSYLAFLGMTKSDLPGEVQKHWQELRKSFESEKRGPEASEAAQTEDGEKTEQLDTTDAEKLADGREVKKEKKKKEQRQRQEQQGRSQRAESKEIEERVVSEM